MLDSRKTIKAINRIQKTTAALRWQQGGILICLRKYKFLLNKILITQAMSKVISALGKYIY